VCCLDDFGFVLDMGNHMALDITLQISASSTEGGLCLALCKSFDFVLIFAMYCSIILSNSSKRQYMNVNLHLKTLLNGD
jgi:hypothetical protein